MYIKLENAPYQPTNGNTCVKYSLYDYIFIICVKSVLPSQGGPTVENHHDFACCISVITMKKAADMSFYSSVASVKFFFFYLICFSTFLFTSLFTPRKDPQEATIG